MRHPARRGGAPWTPTLRAPLTNVSLLLSLALLAQAALLCTHGHAPAPTAVHEELAAADGSPAWSATPTRLAAPHGVPASPADPHPSQDDPQSCGVCAALSLCRVAAVGAEPGALAGPPLSLGRLADAPEAAPRAPEPTGVGARSPPSSIV